MRQVLCKEGFTGGYTTVKDAVCPMRAKAPKKVFMPLTQPPGEAQADFGCALACIGGQLTKITFFVMSMIHSDAAFAMALPGAPASFVVRGFHDDISEHEPVVTDPQGFAAGGLHVLQDDLPSLNIRMLLDV